ncbi:helix-turn-helix transcriptional regulator [Natronorubrum daqingense]|uniref:Predicted transcriptional regulator, contains HTH domain n=1 Tax=Natronorubrum daqingense TaxID=588898 RepID=A0A1N7DUZ2_9EURY|nr:helix-turn-helix domain-containing protein [Natronorubrum daqingense]APX96189.1 hypothetical protein BB347_05880 [Natronorubrum daqingense]SIR79640.1 Predicted transcriptional regulator, contains HTH domain [Natronorubrum daqingense]
MDTSTQEALETVEFLASSPVRLRICSVLADGPQEIQALKSRLEAPRSTLHRNLSALVERGILSRSPAANEYSLTATGEVIHGTFSKAVSTVERAHSLEPFLEYFPDSVSLTTETILTAEVVSAAVDAPFDPVSTVKSAVVAGETVRGFLPVINPTYVDGLRQGLEKDVRIEILAPPTAYERLASTHTETLERLEASPSVQLYESSAVPEYAVGFVDETVLLGAFDDHMRTHSVLQDRAGSALWEWAHERYERVKTTAHRLATGGRDDA